jgi:hypothetical protein
MSTATKKSEDELSQYFEKFLKVQEGYGYSDDKIVDEFCKRESIKDKEKILSVLSKVKKRKEYDKSQCPDGPYWSVGGRPKSATECIAKMKNSPPRKLVALINMLRPEKQGIYSRQQEAIDWCNKNQYRLTEKDLETANRRNKRVRNHRSYVNTVAPVATKQEEKQENKFSLKDAIEMLAEMDFIIKLTSKPNVLPEFKNEIAECNKKMNQLRKFLYSSNGTEIVTR